MEQNITSAGVYLRGVPLPTRPDSAPPPGACRAVTRHCGARALFAGSRNRPKASAFHIFTYLSAYSIYGCSCAAVSPTDYINYILVYVSRIYPLPIGEDEAHGTHPPITACR